MLHTVQEAIEDIKNGKLVIVVDDEDRENEGDFIVAARHCTPEVINFMAKEGRGLICAPIIESKADELGLDLMVTRNTGLHETADYDNFSWGVGNRGCSIRIGNDTFSNGLGYFEDRRPASNMDPYLVTSKILETCML